MAIFKKRPLAVSAALFILCVALSFFFSNRVGYWILGITALLLIGYLLILWRKGVRTAA